MSDGTVMRVSGVGALLFLPLILIGFVGIVGPGATIGETQDEIADYYAQLAFGRTVLGVWIELLAFVGLLLFAAGFCRLLRGNENSWLGLLALASVAAMGGLAAVGVAPLLAGVYRGDHGGLAADQYVLLNTVRIAAYWLSSLFAGAWLLATGAAVVRTRVLATWLGWAGLLVGVVLMVSVAAPLSGLPDIGQTLLGIWLLVTGGALVLRARSAATVAQLTE